MENEKKRKSTLDNSSDEVNVKRRMSRRQLDLPPEFGAYEEPTHGGGIGVPGGRKMSDVEQFSPLNFKKVKTDLFNILSTSAKVHQWKQESPDDYLDKAKPEALKVNRHVVYDEKDTTGTHSLHVGQDVFAYWNSAKKKKGKGYSYDELAPKLDKRLDENLSTHNRSSGGYWIKNKLNNTVEQRRLLVAQGLQHIIGGNIDQAHDQFNLAGLTEKGRKWANKFATVMLAEKGREVYGKKWTTAVHDALGNVGKQSFKQVFVTQQKTLAPFAAKGGAEYFKK